VYVVFEGDFEIRRRNLLQHAKTEKQQTEEQIIEKQKNVAANPNIILARQVSEDKKDKRKSIRPV